MFRNLAVSCSVYLRPSARSLAAYSHSPAHLCCGVTDVLRSAGVPPVVRDEMAESAFPEDLYDLSPATFADLAPELAEAGLVWGAAKAHVVLSRRRGES